MKSPAFTQKAGHAQASQCIIPHPSAEEHPKAFLEVQEGIFSENPPPASSFSTYLGSLLDAAHGEHAAVHGEAYLHPGVGKAVHPGGIMLIGGPRILR